MTLEETIHGLLAEAQQLRDLVPTHKTLTSPELIEEEVTKRKRFSIRLQEAKHKLSSQISTLQAWKRALSIAEGYQRTDVSELDGKRWELIAERKASRA